MNNHSLNILKIPLENLQLVSEIDPLYKPARFFLAYVKLRIGQMEEASKMFADLTAPVNHDAEMIYESIKKEWPHKGLRGSILLKFPPFKPLIRRYLLPWMKLYQEIDNSLTGGIIYLQAKRWSEIKERLKKKRNAKAKDSEFEAALLRLAVHSMTERDGIRKYAELATELETGETSPEKAMEILDIVLDQHDIWRFNSDIEMLLSEITILEFEERFIEFVPRDPRPDKIPDIRKLHDHPVAILFKSKLQIVEKVWQEKDWETCKKILTAIDLETSDPSEHMTPTLLFRALKLPPKSARFIRSFLPAYMLLDKWQATFKHAFYLESAYYYALSRYSTYTEAGYADAREHSFALHDRWLAGQPPVDMDQRRHEELHLLAQCLEVDSAVRLVLSKSSSSKDLKENGKRDFDLDYSKDTARVRLDEILKEKLYEKLVTASANPQLTPNLRASVLHTLGLLQRYQVSENRSGNGKEFEDELGLFFRSLSIRRSPDTCFSIAETLAERERVTEAGHYLQEALNLSPYHSGIKTLMESMQKKSSQ